MTTVRSEPRVYEEDGPNSWLLDTAATAFPGHRAYADANDRLLRYAQEIDVEIKERSVEGRRAERVIREVRRASETRAASSTTMGAFVTPQYLNDLAPVFRTPERTFVNQCLPLPLPPVGLTIHVPSFASTAAATNQGSEGGGVPELDPTGSDIPVPVTTQTGQITMTQALFDRGVGQMGSGYDKLAIKQINAQLDTSIDLYTINQALANAGTVPDAAAISITNFFADLSAARELLTDTAGTRLSGTHLFTTADLSGWITKQVDSQGRPIFLPDAGALLTTDSKPEWMGYLGIALPGHLQWFADDNIPAIGANTQAIVAKPDQIAVFEGDPLSFAYPEPRAQNFSVVVGLRKYVAVLPLYPKAVASISGAALPLTLK